MNNRLTFDDLYPEDRSSSKFTVQEKKGKLRVIKKVENRPPELYENETALKKAAADLLEKLPRCALLKTDNAGLRVRGGKRVKSREPGMSDQHLCINGFFVALEAKMPGKDIKKGDDQDKYREKIHKGGGIHIVYHSLFELVVELKKHRLISKRFEL